MYVFQHVWRTAGWGTIVYLAALTAVDMSLYEAAEIDGANRWKQTWHITLPAIRATIIVLFTDGEDEQDDDGGADGGQGDVPGLLPPVRPVDLRGLVEAHELGSASCRERGSG